ncbi:MAG TPA: hypothetical protein IAD47_02680 [Candidatus Limihabitans stercoravium]|nr:hypothetical protein [Candidatus Limihabitans stercoravium]
MRKKLLVLALVLVLVMSLSVALVACNPTEEAGKAPASELERAKEAVHTMYKDRIPAETASSFSVASVISLDGGVYVFPVSWSVDSNEITVGTPEDNQLTINIPEPSADINYTLTATITADDGTKATVEFERKVPKFVLFTWEQYKEACEAGDETTVVVRGFVVGINEEPNSSSKGSMWIMDAEGNGYYAYKPKLDSKITETRESILAEFPFGTEVTVTGTVTVYGGAYEFDTGCTVVKTGKTATDKGVTLDYTDVTELWSKATEETKYTLIPSQSTLVSLEGVTLGSIDGKNYKFTVEGSDIQYIMYMDTYLMDETELAKLTAKWEVGAKANLKGICNVFGSVYQVYPEDSNALEIINEDLTDAQKVERVKNALDIAVKNYGFSGEVKVATAGDGQLSDVTITYSSNSPAITFDAEKGVLVIDKQPTAQTVTVTATISLNGETATKEFTIKVTDDKYDLVENPVADTAYKFGFYQGNNNKMLYLTGEGKDFLDTTEDATKAPDFFLEAVEGGYKIYWNNNSAKSYIAVYKNSDGKVRLQYNTTGAVWTYDAETATFKTVFEGSDYYLGTYSNFDTASISKWDTMPTSFPSHMVKLRELSADEKVAAAKEALTLEKSYSADFTLPSEGMYGTTLTWTVKEENPALVIDGYNVTVTPGSTAVQVVIVATIALDGATNLTKEITVTVEELKVYLPEFVTEPAAGQYKLAVAQNNLGKTLYFTGAMDGFYLGTTENAGEAVDVTYEVAEGGFYLSFMVDGAKKYVEMYDRGEGKAGVQIVDTPTAVFVLDTKYNMLTAKFGDNTFYLGTYNTFDTLSASNVSFVNDDNVDKTQFPARLATLKVATDADLVQLDKDALELKTSYTDNFTLPATGANGSTITWAVTEGTAITIDGTEATVVRGDADATVKLTATIKLNEETLTKEFTITVPKIVEPGEGALATFTFGENGAAGHVDGSEIQTYTETSNGYTLELTGLTKVYSGAFDAMGNSCLKLGTGRAIASLSFTVGDDVKSVNIYIACYKANKGKVNINGTDYELAKLSNNGEYDCITIDTSSVKTITLATLKGTTRAMINTIEFCA